MASAITCHVSDIVLRTLADRAARLAIDPAVQARLQNAAGAMSVAWPAWRAVACTWDILSTGADTGTGAPPAAADADDLVLRMGRLAYGRPDWTPACAAASAIRKPAATADAMTAVLAAVHHAADAIHRIATADLQAVRTAVISGRLYVPTRLLPERFNVPYRYTRALGSHTENLLATYGTAISASARVTKILDDLATAVGAPSAVLGASRQERQQEMACDCARDDIIAGHVQSSPPSATRPVATPMEHLLESLHITDPAMLARAAAIDQASRQLLADASMRAKRRDIVSVVPPQPTQITSGRPANLASKDIPAHPPNPGQHSGRHYQSDATTAAMTSISRRFTSPRTPNVPR